MRLTCLFDPLCGWCYGATPALQELAHVDGTRLQLAPTGLFTGENARLMDESFAAYAWQSDQRIARLTGQEFSDAYRSQVLGARGALFDSGPATLGIVAVGCTEPDREIEALRALQHARYVDGRDTCELSVVSEVLSRAGFAQAGGRVLSSDAELLGAYRLRMDAARKEVAQCGAEGVPALIVEGAGEPRLLPSSALFGGIEALKSQLRAAA
jgi:putative protein-disulfide isomerase